MPCIGCAQTPSFLVRDKAGNHAQQTLTLYYYFKKLELHGDIKQFMINEQESFVYVLARHYNPNKVSLNVISLETQTVVGVYTLDFFIDYGYILSMAYNPFNNLFYFFTERQSYLYAYSPTQRKLVKTVEITDDHKYYPRKYPVYLAFTRSGKGLLVTQPQDHSAPRLKLIDSAVDDELVAMPDFNNASFHGFSEDLDWANIFMGVNRTGPSNPVLVFTETGQFETLPFTTTGDAGRIKRNKNAPNTLLVQLGQKIFIKKLDTGGESVHAYANSGEASFDFSYAPGETNFAWVYAEDNALVLLNYDETITEIEYIPGAEFHGLTTTNDNKWLLMSTFSDFYFYRIEDIRRTSFDEP
ncbi:MAG: hypothetical protein HRU69_14170 [Flammeovirgaceae bacterium]|nr:MAG: hypothetical protein HRU69_14170 [Flammeovirgaceae bacterium]